MEKVVGSIRYIAQILLLPVYLLTCLVPRTKHIWVLGSTFGRRFADNPKYFYLYLSQFQKRNVRAIWITKNKEVLNTLEENSLEGYYLYSLKGMWYCLRAKVYLYDNYSKDISYALSGGAVKINLWHGIPLKKIQKDNIHDYARNPRSSYEKWKWAIRRISDEKPSHYVLTTSEFLRPVFSSAFQTKKVIISGYPRNDALFQGRIKNVMTEMEQEAVSYINSKKKACKMVMYMPTFRDSEIKFFDVMDMERLRGFLEEERILFCIKLHPKSKLEKKFSELKSRNIYVIPPVADPYHFLGLADILVTDYSSIYFDYLLTKKPVVFFAYDLEAYLKDSRELYFDYDAFTPGTKVYSQEELEVSLLQSPMEHERAQEIRNKVFDEGDSFASQHLYQVVTDILKK